MSLYHRESLVKEATSNSLEGCRITSSACSSSSPCAEDKFHSGAEVILFPAPDPVSLRPGADPHALDRGVLLWMTADGLYAKRLCQARIYWEGPLAPYVDKANKLEKDQPCKLFDTQQFLIGERVWSQSNSFCMSGPSSGIKGERNLPFFRFSRSKHLHRFTCSTRSSNVSFTIRWFLSTVLGFFVFLIAVNLNCVMLWTPQTTFVPVLAGFMSRRSKRNKTKFSPVTQLHCVCSIEIKK